MSEPFSYSARIAPDASVPIRAPWSTEPVVELDRVSAAYTDSEPVIRDVSFSLEEGEILLVVGRTGSGKSTLLNTLTGAMPHFTGGTLTGTVKVVGRNTKNFPPRLLADAVGVVNQDPQASFVAETVEEELAFTMEQMGLEPAVMRRRIEKILDLMGIVELRDAALHTLSGGEQQRVAMGAVLTANPALIVMDEPTSALDPNAAESVLTIIQRLAHELGTTVVLAEHRIERVLQYVDRVAHVDALGAVQLGSPEEIMQRSDVAPPVVELGRWAGWSPLPLSVRHARREGVSLRRQLYSAPVTPAAREADKRGAVLLQARDVAVQFPGIRAVDAVSLELYAGEIVALMGRNGCGKSSLLWALQGTGRKSAGSVIAEGNTDQAGLSPAARRRCVGLVPQTPTDLLGQATVEAELEACGVSARNYLDQLAPGIEGAMHPRDLSEGQRLALALSIQLAAEPQVMLFDEPTRGLDYEAKQALVECFNALRKRGHAVMVATHDVEFAALCADRVVEMAAGQIIAEGNAVDILASSMAYAPQVAKITSGLHHDSRWLTVDAVKKARDE